MTAQLTFNLPEEQEELDAHLNGPKLYSALREFDELLRQRLKYDVNEHWDFKTVEELRHELNQLVEI